MKTTVTTNTVRGWGRKVDSALTLRVSGHVHHMPRLPWGGALSDALWDTFGDFMIVLRIYPRGESFHHVYRGNASRAFQGSWGQSGAGYTVVPDAVLSIFASRVHNRSSDHGDSRDAK